MDRFRMSCDACKNANTFVGDNIFGNEKIRVYILLMINGYMHAMSYRNMY